MMPAPHVWRALSNAAFADDDGRALEIDYERRLWFSFRPRVTRRPHPYRSEDGPAFDAWARAAWAALGRFPAGYQR